MSDRLLHSQSVADATLLKKPPPQVRAATCVCAHMGECVGHAHAADRSHAHSALSYRTCCAVLSYAYTHTHTHTGRCRERRCVVHCTRCATLCSRAVALTCVCVCMCTYVPTGSSSIRPDAAASTATLFAPPGVSASMSAQQVAEVRRCVRIAQDTPATHSHTVRMRSHVMSRCDRCCCATGCRRYWRRIAR
jgi:hypothetical protein